MTRITSKELNQEPRFDRLSNLHETMVSNILSRLPTKDVVRTSILSKDWRRKWVSLYNVDTDIESWGKSYGGLTFYEFLDEILVSRQHLRSFRAKFLCGMRSDAKRWIAALMGHNLEFLDINLNGNRVAFPSSLLNSTSLRELIVVQVYPFVKINVAEKNSAPNLTSMSLCNVVFVNRNLNSSSVLFDFLVLERLEFNGAAFGYRKWMNVKYVEIYAPSLTTFSFEFQSSLYYRGQDHNYTTKIVAPKLTTFSCFVGLPGKLIIDGSSIVSAFLYGRYNLQEVEKMETRVTDLLNGLTNLEELTLSRSMVKVLRNGPPLHRHDKLRRLTLLKGKSSAEEVFKLVHAMPSLEFLSIDVGRWPDYDYEAMETIPSCIAFHMEEVVLRLGSVFDHITNGQPLFNLAKFILKTAKELKKFTIIGDEVHFCENLKRFFSTFYHCSPSLEICSRLPDLQEVSRPNCYLDL